MQQGCTGSAENQRAGGQIHEQGQKLQRRCAHREASAAPVKKGQKDRKKEKGADSEQGLGFGGAAQRVGGAAHARLRAAQGKGLKTQQAQMATSAALAARVESISMTR